METAQQQPPDPALVKAFEASVKKEAEDRGARPADTSAIDKSLIRCEELAAEVSTLAPQAAGDSKAASQLVTVRKQLAAERAKLIRTLEKFVADAKFRENNLLREKKFEAAYFDVDRSEYEIGIGNELPEKKLDSIEKKVLETRESVDKKATAAEVMKEQRKELERILAQITAEETQAKKAYDEQEGKLKQLEKALRTGRQFRQGNVGLADH